ncbi:hypothetical protein Megpolyxen_00630 [Candidatus Megaera polyxenophila]|nr:hypothetical protein Megpolyxen_00630 [Candidatus Megaera polyxenophila]
MRISDPNPTSNALTPQEMQVYVKEVLVPIIDDFTKNHKGKQFTADNVETLYNDLNKALSKDPRILDKWGGGIDQDSVRKDMAKQMAETLNTESKLSKSEQLIKGFGEFCKKIGLGKIGDACLKYTQGITLKKSAQEIASGVASTKMSVTVGESESAKIAKPIQKGQMQR